MHLGGYWLAEWLDKNHIRSISDAKKYLRDPRRIEALRDTAATVSYVNESPIDGDERGIIAGQRIDLSGNLGCLHPDCLRKDVDTLFSQVWHYFDTIVVVGLTPWEANSLLEHADEVSVQKILAYIETFFYIRGIGAEHLLLFRQKPPACVEHLQQHAREYGAASVLEHRKNWIEQISPLAHVGSLRRRGDHWHYGLNYPGIHVMNGVVQKAKGTPDREEILSSAFDIHAANMISDIGAARAADLPIGTSGELFGGMVGPVHAGIPSVQGALFELSLPVLQGIPTKELIRIRQENWQYFDAFRLALKNAAGELLSNASENMSSARIARQIESDIIEPELVRIRRELRIAVDTLSDKSIVGLPLGALGTAIGLLDKLPVAATGAASAVAVAGLAAFLVDYKKYVDDKGGIKTSDMYFIWTAERSTSSRKRFGRR